MVWVGRNATPQQGASLRPMLDRVTESKATVDHIGQQLAKISTQDEVALGRSLMERELEGSAAFRDGLRENSREEAYLRGILDRLKQSGIRRRPDMPFEVRLIEHPAVNAFALPGGYLFVTTGMLDYAQSEAELAAVIGHEMAHVDLRHCIERYQYRIQAKRIGGKELEAMASLGTRLMLQGYQDDQEAEADRWGMQIAASVGYHPQAGQTLFLRMQSKYEGQRPVPRHLGEEVQFGVMDGLEDVFATHPQFSIRIANLDRAFQETGCLPEAKPWYVGIQNRRELIALSAHNYPGEWKQGRMAP